MRKIIVCIILIICIIVASIKYKEVLFKNVSMIKDWISIFQSIVIITVTIFTAWWTYKTFAHKEKLNELKELMAIIELYHMKMTIFCAQVRSNEEFDNKELNEKLELGQIHNKLASLSKINLYNRKEFRDKVQGIVGRWLCNEQIRNMQRGRKASPSEEVTLAAWERFNSDYEKVKQLIEMEVKKYIA